MAYNPKKIAGGVAGGALLMFGAVGGIGATAGLPQTADADRSPRRMPWETTS